MLVASAASVAGAAWVVSHSPLLTFGVALVWIAAMCAAYKALEENPDG